MSDNKITEELGFYFMVFQPNPSRDQIKYWMDGDTSYSFMPVDDFLKLVPSILRPAAKRALMDYSIFLWDVGGGYIRRLAFKGEEEPLVNWIKSKKTEHEKEPEQKEVHEPFWKRFFRTSKDGDVKIDVQ